jgi:hypothetical protein
MLRLFTECHLKILHAQGVDATILKIASVGDDHLERDVRSAISGMNAVHRYELFRGSSVGTVQILVRYCVSFSTTLVPQLQLWHLHWLVSVQSAGYMHSRLSEISASRAISRELLHESRSTAAIVASSLAGVHTVRGIHAFTSARDISSASRKRCYNY